jgi:hypothetical protein
MAFPLLLWMLAGCDGSVNGMDPPPPDGATADGARTDGATGRDGGGVLPRDAAHFDADSLGCDPGTTDTAWATECPAAAPVACVPGTWRAWGSSSPEDYPLRFETAHFAFYWPNERAVSMADAEAAADFLEDVVWQTYIGAPMFFPEPDCTRADKRKTSIHLIADGLFGGCNEGRPGIWVGPGALRDHWGLGHEFAHALQCMTPGVPDCGGDGCWLHESHANFMSHQLPEYRDEVHCSEMLVNAPHVYYGSTRDRYCNWQFLEFVKDKHCYRAVNEIWSASDVPRGLRDPFNKLAAALDLDASALNDLFGEWAMHNVTWDYRDPPPTEGSDRGPVYRGSYGRIDDTSRPERRRRVTELEPLDGDWAANRRFVSPFYWAPQRWGYNVVRLHPDPGATRVTVAFRGVVQEGADSGWRWGLVATDDALTSARYSALHGETDGSLELCLEGDEALWLVVVGAPTSIRTIVWDEPYPSIHRYPYMIELANAWPDGFEGGARAECPSGTEPHENGGGCAPATLAASVFVGPYARVLGGTVSGDARIVDHAIVLGATVSGGTVGALTTIDRFTVRDSAVVETTFYPPGFFERNQGLSGTARLFGDVEYRGEGLDRSSGSFYGFVDASTPSRPIDDVTVPPPYTWR